MEIQNNNHKDEQNIIFYNTADGKDGQVWINKNQMVDEVFLMHTGGKTYRVYYLNGKQK
jgi:stress response protein SCP2